MKMSWRSSGEREDEAFDSVGALVSIVAAESLYIYNEHG